MTRGTFWMCAVALGMLACNEERDAEPTPQALAKCETYVTMYCDRQVQCFQLTPDAAEQCRASFRQTLSCATAVATTESYDACLAAIAGDECAASAAATTPPSVCNKVIVNTP